MAVTLSRVEIIGVGSPLDAALQASLVTKLGRFVGRMVDASLVRIEGGRTGNHVFALDITTKPQIAVPSAVAMERCPGLNIGGRAKFAVSRPAEGDSKRDTLFLTLQSFDQTPGVLIFDTVDAARRDLLERKPLIRGATISRPPTGHLMVTFHYGVNRAGQEYIFSAQPVGSLSIRLRPGEEKRVSVQIIKEGGLGLILVRVI